MKVQIVRPGQRYRKPTEAGGEPLDVEPDTFMYGDGKYSTYGASTCLVFAAHNSKSRLGLLGHFNSLIGVRDGLSRSVTYETALYTLPELGPKDKTEIWLGGIAESRLEDLDLAEENRQYARDRLDIYLERFSIPETLVRVDWNPSGTYINARLACDTGRLLVRQAFDIS